MQNLSIVEEEIFRFLRKSFHLDKRQVKSAFVVLKDKLEKYKDNPLESRSFMYLDIISWLKVRLKCAGAGCDEGEVFGSDEQE